MNKTLLASTLLSMTLASPLWAGTPTTMDANQLDARTICEQYAHEDQINPNQMADYVARCLQDMNSNPDASQMIPPMNEGIAQPMNPAPTK